MAAHRWWFGLCMTGLMGLEMLTACAPDSADATETRTSVPTERSEAVPLSVPNRDIQSPSELYPVLFPQIALSGVVDPKDWADAVPLFPADEINAAYEKEAPQTRAAMRAFVETHFRLPEEMATPNAWDGRDPRTLSDHIDALWAQLTRAADDEHEEEGSLIPLPYDYVVPGGRFREVYYWDAYFTMAGMIDGYDRIKRRMVDNFAYLIDDVGHIPNVNRTYYISRSQPPFFFAMVGLLSEGQEELAWADYLDAMRAEYRFWMAGADGLAPGEASRRVVRMPDGNILNRYWDDRDVPRDESFIQDHETAARSDREPAELFRDLRAGAESGWDFTSRWLDDPNDLSTIRTTRIIPVDLNSLMYGMERAIAAGCTAEGDTACAAEFEDRASRRKAAMNTYLWDPDKGIFGDYDWEREALTPHLSAASIYPLFLGVATPSQAASTAGMVREDLLAPEGMLSTPVVTGEQWDAPNGWAPLHYMAAVGFDAYGEETLARTIAERWLSTVARSYCQSGKLVEKYNVAEAKPGGGGEYPTQDGFGWTNGVTAALLRRYPDLAGYGDVRPAGADLDRCEAIGR
ncbi:alpha,alpha-trehalase TreF [Parvularcula sp. LCG005]|uniref:alpha,alpha-trehalase TreF n=1 Tax=Parvularcula sp. LCG005 TaxID=3078805 RepID=UPI002942A6E8|nr:alpha,alpha-trehalase TreF [Parvularcula sp. LCG005]WOI53852.1 alpha,alpha-trehalase TreF [Parvularcula sp. LCG005]